MENTFGPLIWGLGHVSALANGVLLDMTKQRFASLGLDFSLYQGHGKEHSLGSFWLRDIKHGPQLTHRSAAKLSLDHLTSDE